MNRTLKSFWFPLTSVFVLPSYSPLHLEITLYEVNHSTFQNCFCVFSTADVRETVNSCFEVFSNRAFDSMKLKWFLFMLLTGDSLTSWVLFSLELWFIFFKWSSFRSLPVPGAHWQLRKRYPEKLNFFMSMEKVASCHYKINLELSSTEFMDQ